MSSFSLTSPLALRRPTAKSRAEKAGTIATGGVPRAHLLPPSVLATHRGRRQVRTMLVGLAGLLVVVLIGTGAAGYLSVIRAGELAAERARTDALLSEQAGYADIAGQLAAIDGLASARSAAGAMSVDWSAYLAELRSALPAGTGLLGYVIAADTPGQSVLAPTAPLAQPRMATLTLTVSTPDLSSAQVVLDRFEALAGVVDIGLGTVTLDDTGRYSSVVTLALDESIRSGRYDTEVVQ